jgi:hypothetical protein
MFNEKGLLLQPNNFYNKKKHSVYITNEEKGRQIDRYIHVDDDLSLSKFESDDAL